MGYYTFFKGEIELSNEKVAKIIKYMIDNEVGVFKEIYTFFTVEGLKVRVHGTWKNYESEMEKVCLFIAKLDNGAKGFIKAYGEDYEDLWALKIEDGKAIFMVSEIAYYEDREMEDGYLTDDEVSEVKKLVEKVKSHDFMKDVVAYYV